MEADKGHRESLTPSMGLIPLPRSTQTCANKKTRAGPSGFSELAKAYPEEGNRCCLILSRTAEAEITPTGCCRNTLV